MLCHFIRSQAAGKCKDSMPNIGFNVSFTYKVSTSQTLVPEAIKIRYFIGKPTKIPPQTCSLTPVCNLLANEQ